MFEIVLSTAVSKVKNEDSRSTFKPTWLGSPTSAQNSGKFEHLLYIYMITELNSSAYEDLMLRLKAAEQIGKWTLS